MTLAYALLNDAGGKFTIVDNEVRVAGPLPGGPETIRVKATDENGWSKEQDFIIPVAFVLKDLALSHASFSPFDPAGTVIGQILNRTVGSTLSITPADGRLAIDGKGNLVVGLTSSSSGTISATIRETLADAVGNPKDTSLTITVAVAKPVNTAAPAISGSFLSGQTLQVSNGSWSGSPTSYAYQWTADGVSISGATSATYLIGTSDIGKEIGCIVWAASGAGSTSATASGAAIANLPPNSWKMANGMPWQTASGGYWLRAA